MGAVFRAALRSRVEEERPGSAWDPDQAPLAVTEVWKSARPLPHTQVHNRRQDFTFRFERKKEDSQRQQYPDSTLP